MKRIICAVLAALIIISALSAAFAAGKDEKTVKILFTHDVHAFFDSTETEIDGAKREHGGAARLKTLLDENRDENTVYLDGGDFSMGTLLQAGYATDAYELRILGALGCDVTTFGNHEFDFGGSGAASMLEAALYSGERMPKIVQSNMVLTGRLTEEQLDLAAAIKKCGGGKYTVLDVGGVKMAVFGLLGIDGIECAPTSGMDFVDYIEAAKDTVRDIKENTDADMIVCLSHSGTTGDGEKGEDFDLARQVPDIDVIISAHSHSIYTEPVIMGDTIVVSCHEYLNYLGSLELAVSETGVRCVDYKLIPCDENVAEDEEMAAKIAEYKEHIRQTYLAKENVGYDDVLCRSDYSFMSFEEMASTHQEYPLGNLIADSYRYEAERNGIDDIDVAIVGLGTIRGTLYEGDITVSDAFEVCSLGVGGDGSSGHPLIGAYITGKELKLLVELDASLGPMVSYIKMSYSGLEYTFNTKRMLLDRVTDVCLVREDGTHEEIDDDRLYKVCCNMYAANMLGMLNGLTKGVLSIAPKNADGSPVEDFYDCSLINTDGDEIKEWVAFKNYLASMPEKDGVPTLSEEYSQPEGRKNKVSLGGLERIKHPGGATIAMMILCAVVLAGIIVLDVTRKERWAKARAKRAKRRAERAAKKAEKMKTE